MRTFWSFTALVEVMSGGHDKYEIGRQFVVQCLAAPTRLDEALPEIDRFLRSENLQPLDVSKAVRYDLDDEDEEIFDYLRGDGEVVADTGQPMISVYITFPAAEVQRPS
jgi:hypothetical protein